MSWQFAGCCVATTLRGNFLFAGACNGCTHACEIHERQLTRKTRAILGSQLAGTPTRMLAPLSPMPD